MLAAAMLAVALPSAAAHAATWGSFDASRMAYATGPLTGTVHAQLRGLIEANGDEVGPATGLLTPEYLETVDVFYTAMLSDGTGPSAGSLGTLSLDERAALEGFVAAGGTLVVTADSNGFDGPYPIVYDSWLSDYGVGDFAFVFSFATGMPVVAHPLTDGVGSISADGYVTFSYPGEGEILANIDGGIEPLMVVFEPATGFAEGGRIVVLGDHNALTDNYIGDADNLVLGDNLVQWAAGECGNGIVESEEDCDDGNVEDGDGCSATCTADGGSETGDGGATGGDESTGADGTGDGGSSAGGTTLPPVGSTGDFEDTDFGEEGSPQDVPASEEGCSCRGGGGSPRGLVLLAPLLLGLRRRRRAGE
ncbi:MAG: myxococcus cysteine-rich repeat containing protein [Nannocystaceae bacterium]